MAEFVRQNKREIDMKRASYLHRNLFIYFSLLLKTPKDTLNSILKKEDMERKMQEMMGSDSNKKNVNKYAAVADHLPFANLIGKIASELPDAPKIPAFSITMHYE